MSLSEAQRNAAHRIAQDVCVLAGPGSGKTSVLIERFTCTRYPVATSFNSMPRPW